ncbi:MAG: 50S ribosomal protein L25 [Gemmatimonadetes bacterium]|jgi:large subunit ribosomal protein L25|nr:50S ribosomal protein L25 [Gemmatimonadota bacterium]
MATTNVSAKFRSTVGKGAARKLRAGGEIPAVIYGHGREPQSLTLHNHTFERLLEKVAYKTTVFELTFDNGTSAKTLIREIQRHSYKRFIQHVDFQELVAGETVTMKVPLTFVGTATGVREGGGILEEVMREVMVACDPSNIPNHLEMNVANLTVGHSYHVRDIPVPAGVEMITHGDETICLVAIPKASAEPTPAEAAAAAEPELIRKAKADEEAAAAEKK